MLLSLLILSFAFWVNLGEKLPFHASIFLCEIKGYQHFTFPLKWSEAEIKHPTPNKKKSCHC